MRTYSVKDTLYPAPEDGADAVTYQLIPSVTQLKTNATRTISTSCTVKAYKTVGSTRSTFNGMIAVRGYDESGAVQFTTAGSGTVTFSTNSTGSNRPLCIRFECALGLTSGEIVAQLTIPVVMDGKKGDPGVTALPVPAGEYDSTVTYTNNGTITPYVLDGSNYYVLIKVGSVTNVKPSTDVANHGGNWMLMENYNAIFTKILMTRLGLVGKAVFWDRYMFSQYGKLGDTVINTEGNYAQPTDAGGTFSPNILIDFLTGFFRCKNAEVTGTVNADAGYFGDMKISGTKFDSKTGKLHFGVNNNSYTYISTSVSELTQNANLYLSNENGGYGIYAHSNTTALKLIGSKAIDSDGALEFRNGDWKITFGQGGISVYRNQVQLMSFYSTGFWVRINKTRFGITEGSGRSYFFFQKWDEEDEVWENIWTQQTNIT